MKVLLVGNFCPDQLQSMKRFCDLMEEGLVKAGHRVQVLRPKPFFYRLWNRNSTLQKWLGYLDKFVLFPIELRRSSRSYDILHIIDQGYSMYGSSVRSPTYLVTCHDLMAVKSALGLIPQRSTSFTGRILQRTILNGLKRAPFVVCDSRRTKADVIQCARRTPENTSSIYLGLNYNYRPMPREDALQRAAALISDPDQPFFIHVGGNHWYKNRPGLLNIFKAIHENSKGASFRLVCVGDPFTSEMQNFISTHHLEQHVFELVGIPSEDLCALYSLSAGLIFPSLDEGFGWPIIEAQACGCPILASNLPPMTEVAANVAVFFDPADPLAAAAIILDAPSLSAVKVAHGLRDIKFFDGDRMVADYLRIYRHLTSVD